MSVCLCLSVCVSRWVSPGCTADKKGQREARGYPLLTGCLWRAQETAPESGLMVEMDAQSPRRVIPFMANAHLWYMERRQMPARAAVGHRGDWTDSSGWCGGRAQLWTHATVQGHAGGDWVLLRSHRRGKGWELIFSEPTGGRWS